MPRPPRARSVPRGPAATPAHPGRDQPVLNFIKQWSFWSFVLEKITPAGQGYYAEIIFGSPSLVLFTGDGIISPLQNLSTPLTSANIVGVAAGCTDAPLWFNGSVYQVVGRLPPFFQMQTITQSAVLNAADSNPGISVTVNDGAATMNSDWILAFSDTNNPTSAPQLFLLGNIYEGQLAAGIMEEQNGVDVASYACSGVWTFGKSWATGPAAYFSMQNPPLALPAFPPGGPFVAG
jgi:hypothetical protein